MSMHNQVKLLFITRKYPPMVGGMEKVSEALAREFSKNVDTTLITWGKSQKYLPLVYPWFLIKALYLIPKKGITRIHIGDALLSPLGVLLKFVFGIKTSITLYGLDITFNFPGYQWLIPKCVSRMDKIICISNATLEEGVKRGIPREKCTVIPCGVYPENWIVPATRNDLEAVVGKKLKSKRVLITVGRLVRRKGVSWFIENVLPKLNKNIVYLVVGDGPEKKKIEQLIDSLDLREKVILLGKITDKKLKILYNTADLFIMPNIKIGNNMEGFGIVAVEASSAGLPVIASRLEGIQDAVVDKKNGILIPMDKSQSWNKVISSPITLKKSQIKNWTMNNYHWAHIADEYIRNIKYL